MTIMMMIMIIFMVILVQELERDNEIQTKREMKAKRLAMTDVIWDITEWVLVLLWRQNAIGICMSLMLTGRWRCCTRRTGPARSPAAWRSSRSSWSSLWRRRAGMARRMRAPWPGPLLELSSTASLSSPRLVRLSSAVQANTIFNLITAIAFNT